MIEVAPIQEIGRRGIGVVLRTITGRDTPGAVKGIRPAQLESYLSDRLRRPVAGSLKWIDQLPLSAVIESAEMIGAFLCHPSFRKQDLSEHEWQEYGEAGYAALAQGPDGFLKVLTDHISTAIAPSASGYSKLFGSTYPWLIKRSSDPDYREVVAVVRAVARRALRAEYPVSFLGEQIPPINGCTVLGLANRYHLPNRTVRRVLRLSGVDADGTVETVWGTASLYPEVRAKEALRFYKDHVDGRKAREMLGATQAIFDSLLSHGVFTAIPQPLIRGPRYSERLLNRLISRLNLSMPTVVRNAEDLLTFAEAARRVPCDAGVIARLVLGKKLRKVTSAVRPASFASVHVDVAEIRHFLGNRSSLQFLKARERFIRPRQQTRDPRPEVGTKCV